MPHLVILYTGNLDAHVDMSRLCRALADTMLSVRDASDKQVFPTGGTRVLAYPAAHHALADGGAAGQAAVGDGDYGFIYLNLRMNRGRTPEVQKKTGEMLLDTARRELAPLFASGKPVGMTLQVDEGAEVFDGKQSTLHPLFNKP